MKAWISTPGSFSLQETASSAPAAGEVKLRVEAAGINFLDALMIQRRAGFTPNGAFTPGIEAAGTIVAVGSGVADRRVGQRVVSFVTGGAFATDLVCPAARTVELPEMIDCATAAAACVSYGTVYYALMRRAGLTAQDRVLIAGATGATGLAAVNLAHHVGAAVVAIGGSLRKLAIATELGAAQALSYTAAADVDSFVGRGSVDVLLDTAGGELLRGLLPAVRSGGKVLCVGSTSLQPQQFDHLDIMIRNIDLIGISFGRFVENEPAVWRQDLSELLALVAMGRLRPCIYQRYSLQELPHAIDDLLSRRTHGKLVLAS